MIETVKVDGATLRVGPGALLRLTKEQAKARSGCLEKVGEDVFRATQGLEFKSGETLGIALDDVPKHLRGHVMAQGGMVAAALAPAPKARAKG